jgi:hypothetical protein
VTAPAGAADATFRVLVITPWPPFEHTWGPVQLRSDLAGVRPDALLSIFHPEPELLRFDGPRFLYNCEPVMTPGMGVRLTREGREVVDRLAENEWLWHAHPNPALRVPHVTHRTADVVSPCETRACKAVAVVSNSGWSHARPSPAQRERNAFATAPRVDLFGAPGTWKHFRRRWLFRKEPPLNYRGPVPGAWGDTPKLQLMSGYHAAVCMENSQEPYYFTEKFVDAVRAGCVPIYRAHETVRSEFLTGAAWVDPADFGGDVQRTIDAALGADREAIAAQNRLWLQRPAPSATSVASVFDRVASIIWRAVEGAGPA